MDPAKTAPFELGSGDDACLLVHGFTGSPWDMRPLGEALAARGLLTKGLRLPGHGMTPEAMLDVSHEDWLHAVETAALALRDKRRLLLAGLSMGALLSVMVAARHPGLVAGLILLAPAMRFKGATMRLVQLTRELPLVPLLRPWVEKQSTDLEDPVARAEAPILRRFPSPRLFDLLKVQDAARAAMGNVRAPALVVAARSDHVVSLDGARALAKGLKSSSEVRLVTLEKGFHIIPRDHGFAALLREVDGFLDGVLARSPHGHPALRPRD